MNDIPKEVRKFKAQVILLKHSGQIRAGYAPVAISHIAHTLCKFQESLEKIDRRCGKKLENNPLRFMCGDVYCYRRDGLI